MITLSSRKKEFDRNQTRMSFCLKIKISRIAFILFKQSEDALLFMIYKDNCFS